MFKKTLQILLVFCSIGVSLKAQCPAASTFAGSDMTICAGSTATLAATLPSGFTGTWTEITFFQAGTITTPSSPTSTVTGLNNAATLSEIWTITDGAGCTNIRDTVRIVVQNAPTSANAGADKTICLGDLVTLGATAAPAGSMGGWSYLNGTNSSTAVITDPTNRQSTVTGLNVAGTDALTWTVSNTACAAYFIDTILITSGNPPAPANAGNDVSGCVGDTLTLFGSITTVGSPVWSRAGVTFLNTNNVRFVPNANNDTVKVALNTAGTYTLYYTVSVGATNLNSPCTTQDTLILTVNPALTVNAGPDQISCDGSTTTFTVLGNKPAVGFGQWAIAGSVTGSVTTTLDTVGTVVGLSPGINTLMWQITDGVCTATDYMTIAVGPPPTAVAGGNVTGCDNDTLTLIGSAALGGIPTWTRAAGVLNTDVSFVPNGNNDTVKIRLRNPGTFKLYYTIALGTTGAAAACYSRDSLEVTIDPAPTTANIAGTNALSSCDTATFTLNGNAPAGGETGAWSILGGAQGALTPVSATSVTVSGLAQGTTTVVWTISGANGCSSTDKATISIGANAGPDLIGCIGDNAFQINGSNPQGWTPLWSTQGSAIATIVGSATSANVTVSITGAGTIKMLYTVIDNGTSCVSTDTMNLTAIECALTGVATDETDNVILIVYPNPNQGNFFVTLKDTKISSAEISVLTIDGRTVLIEQLGSVKDIQTEISLSDVAEGIYFIRIKKGEETHFSKIAIQ